MGATAGSFIEALASRHRVLVIGGLAVIAHGFNRSTKDADLWLEPFASPEAWAAAVEEACSQFSGLTVHGLPGWRRLPKAEVARAVREMAAEGDPFSQALLEERDVPYDLG